MRGRPAALEQPRGAQDERARAHGADDVGARRGRAQIRLQRGIGHRRHRSRPAGHDDRERLRHLGEGPLGREREAGVGRHRLLALPYDHGPIGRRQRLQDLQGPDEIEQREVRERDQGDDLLRALRLGRMRAQPLDHLGCMLVGRKHRVEDLLDVLP